MTAVRDATAGQLALHIGTGRIGELIGMAIELHDIAEGILAIDHPVGLLAGIVVAHLLHALTATIFFDQLDAALEIRVLYAEMKQAGPPVFERLAFRFGLWKFE